MIVNYSFPKVGYSEGKLDDLVKLLTQLTRYRYDHFIGHLLNRSEHEECGVELVMNVLMYLNACYYINIKTVQENGCMGV